MSDPKPNGRFHVGTVVMLLGMIGGPLAVWGDAQRDKGKTEERIGNVERRLDDERKNTREDINEVKNTVRGIEQNTQTILQELRSMQAVQKERERRETRR